MVEWHHRLNAHEFEQALGDVEGQGSLACYSPWGCKEMDTTEWLNKDVRICIHLICAILKQRHYIELSSFFPISFNLVWKNTWFVS